jgi:hypothetical protein
MQPKQHKYSFSFYEKRKEKWINYKISQLEKNPSLLPYSINCYYGKFKVDADFQYSFTEKETTNC